MNDYSSINKAAWEHDAYAFWHRQMGAPAEAAKRIAADPAKALRRFAAYFGEVGGLRVANICGSCGKKALPLALLGAQVTVFDISRDNQRYALEMAQAVGAALDYQVGDVMQTDLACYGGAFDVVFMEGGVLHYFHDLPDFMRLMHALLKPGGRMICSDFHPFTKLQDTLGLQTRTMSYFCTDVFEGEMAHARFYDAETRSRFPKCLLRKYTVSEIINAVIGAGFTLRRFDEHPAWDDPTLPGEFTLAAEKP
ncbi:MAG: class I SAM-dependent methyltransferase [Clostridia bacterium]|nr:class I SAM-dependent methyltransferase [Clostridia bacterium]